MLEADVWALALRHLERRFLRGQVPFFRTIEKQTSAVRLSLTSFCASSLSFLLAASDMIGACLSYKDNR